MAKFLLLILAITVTVFSVVQTQGQQKRKNVQKKPNKSKSVEYVEAPNTNIASAGSILPEENENAWRELTFNQDNVKISFPGKPAEYVIRDKFAKKQITRINYILETKKGTYVFGFFSWIPPKTISLSESYDMFTKDLLAREGSRVKLKEVKEFSVNNLIGRELTLDDTQKIDTFRYRIILVNDTFYYISVMPSLFLSPDETRNAENFFSKFLDSFIVFAETKKRQY